MTYDHEVSRLHRADLVTPGLEVIGEERAQVRFVLDHQNAYPVRHAEHGIEPG